MPAATNAPSAAGRRRRLFGLFVVALLAPAQLLVFGAFDTYRRNEGEFAASFVRLAVEWLPLLTAMVLVLGAAGLMLPRRWGDRYVAALFALGVLLWVQGNLLVADYGLLYGKGLDLARHHWRAPYELGAWTLVLGLAVAFAGRVASLAPFASGILIALQAAALLATGTLWRAASPDAADGGTAGWSPPPPGIYQLSDQRNVVHLVLDGFLSEVFQEFVQAEREAADRAFAGFVFFPDHLGAFPTTRASIPAMLAGVAYRNEERFGRFRREMVERRSVFAILPRHGYRMTSIMFHGGAHPRAGGDRLVRYTIPTPYGSYREYTRSAAAQLLDLTLFRHVPHGLKAGVYGDGEWLLQGWWTRWDAPDAAARNERASNHLRFFDEFVDRLDADADRPVYLFMHVALPHPPVALDASCGFVGLQKLDRTSYSAQARCTIRAVQRLLDRLRSLGIYDRTAVLLTADHGWEVPGPDHPLRHVRTPPAPLSAVGSTAMPLLAVKPAAASGPLRISPAPTALTDVPATILDLAGLDGEAMPGRSVFAVDPHASRSRSFAYHSWDNAGWRLPYFDVLYEFSVDGRVLDPSSWTFRRALFAPSADLEAQLERREAGLSSPQPADEGTVRWGGPYVVTYAPPDARAFTVVAGRSPRAESAQTLTIRIDGQVARRLPLTGESWHTVRLPLSRPVVAPHPFTIELLVEPHAEDGWPFAARYRTLQWTR